MLKLLRIRAWTWGVTAIVPIHPSFTYNRWVSWHLTTENSCWHPKEWNTSNCFSKSIWMTLISKSDCRKESKTPPFSLAPAHGYNYQASLTSFLLSKCIQQQFHVTFAQRTKTRLPFKAPENSSLQCKQHAELQKVTREAFQFPQSAALLWQHIV